jgi:hypothetical protein
MLCTHLADLLDQAVVEQSEFRSIADITGSAGSFDFASLLEEARADVCAHGAERTAKAQYLMCAFFSVLTSVSFDLLLCYQITLPNPCL